MNINEITEFSEEKKAEIIAFAEALYQEGFEAGKAMSKVGKSVHEQWEALPKKSPNQQRAELIQRAREFVEDLSKTIPSSAMRNLSNGKWEGGLYLSDSNLYGFVKAHDLQFVINEEKRTVVALIHHYDRGKRIGIRARGIAKCMPDEVFNADIGKAIALARALEIEVPQVFLQAVQPDEYVKGHAVYSFDTSGKRFDYPKITDVTEDRIWEGSFFCYKDSGDRYGLPCVNPVITDDTNAIYEEASQ